MPNLVLFQEMDSMDELGRMMRTKLSLSKDPSTAAEDGLSFASLKDQHHKARQAHRAAEQQSSAKDKHSTSEQHHSADAATSAEQFPSKTTPTATPAQAKPPTPPQSTTPPPQQAKVTTDALEEAIAKKGESIFLQEDKDGHVTNQLIMSIFDLGGQSSFYVFHPFFMNEHSVFPCVFNMADVLDEKRQADALMFLEQWWFMIHHYAFNAPILLVGTHADKVSTRQEHERVQTVLLAKLQNYPHVLKAVQHNKHANLCFYPVDNTKSGADAGIQALRVAIATTSAQMEIAKVQVPLSWVALYDKLKSEQKTKPMLHIGELNTIAAGYGMT